MPTQRFILDQRQRTAVAVCRNNAATSMPLLEKFRFSENLTKYFLKRMKYLNWIINQQF